MQNTMPRKLLRAISRAASSLPGNGSACGRGGAARAAHELFVSQVPALGEGLVIDLAHSDTRSEAWQVALEEPPCRHVRVVERAAEVRYRPKNKPPATSAERGLRFVTRSGILKRVTSQATFTSLLRPIFMGYAGCVIDSFALLSEFTAFNNHYGYHLPAPSGLEADPQGPISRAVATRLLQVHPVQR